MTYKQSVNPLSQMVIGGWPSNSNQSLKSLITPLTISGTALTGGDAVGIRFLAPTSAPLTDYLFMSNDIVGTPGATVAYLCAGTSNTSVVGEILETASVVPTIDTTGRKWWRLQFSGATALTVGEVYWIVIGAATADASNYASLLVVSSGPRTGNLRGDVLLPVPYTSSNGFTTVGSSTNTSLAYYMGFADGTKSGQPYSANAASTNAVYRRGMRIKGLTASLKINTFYKYTTDPDAQFVKIYTGDNYATADYTLTLSTPQKSANFTVFPDYQLNAGVSYRICVEGSGGAFTMIHHTMEDTGNSTIRDMLYSVRPFEGGVIYTYESGGAWVDDEESILAVFAGVSDQVGSAAASINGVAVEGISSIG